MATTVGWQQKSIEELSARLFSDPDVLALVVRGSLAQPERSVDQWSDVDATIVVGDDGHHRYFPSPAWLGILDSRPIGVEYFKPFGLRVLLEDLRRFDIDVTPRSYLLDLERWRVNPFWEGYVVVFCRSAEVEYALGELSRRSPKPRLFASSNGVDDIARRFWFHAAAAVTKVVRKDPATGLRHLLEMTVDCVALSKCLAETGDTGRRSDCLEQALVADTVFQNLKTSTDLLAAISAMVRLFDDLFRTSTRVTASPAEALLRLAEDARTWLE